MTSFPSLIINEMWLNAAPFWTDLNGTAPFFSLALPNALDTIKRSLNELCEETTDAMIPTFIQAMKAWMKTQELQHEKDIINRSMPSPKESVSYFTCSLSNPISNGGRNSPHC